MTRGDKRCTLCGRDGHTRGNCPDDQRGLRWLGIAACLCVLAVVALPGCASTPQPGAATVELTADQVRICQEQGGCAMLTRARMAQLLEKAALAGRQTCGKDTPL